MPRPRKRVALLLETPLGSGREILRGIERYAREAGDWQHFHAAGGLPEGIPGWMERWEGEGVVARGQNEATPSQGRRGFRAPPSRGALGFWILDLVWRGQGEGIGQTAFDGY
jgi:hypothetical protein